MRLCESHLFAAAQIHETIDCVYLDLCIVLRHTLLFIFVLRMKRHYSEVKSYDLICFLFLFYFLSCSLSSVRECLFRSLLSITICCISVCPSMSGFCVVVEQCFIFSSLVASIEHVTFEYQSNT